MKSGGLFGTALVAVAFAATAHADAPMANVSSLNVLGMQASQAFSDPTLRARRTYEVIAKLPVASSIDQTYDLRGFVAPVVDAQIKVRQDLVVQFPLGISGKQVLTADFLRTQGVLGGTIHTRLAVEPSEGFGRGGLVSMWMSF